MQNLQTLTLLLTIQLCQLSLVDADLQFGKPKTIPPEVDSSAQYRSVIMPRIFGGDVIEKPLKTVGFEIIKLVPNGKLDHHFKRS